ncbi:MAG: DUF502 domain-containing protein [Dehalococcoidales bacterium]|nr:DUF502 domain-containing protein [Dehalococcoidales bacterium]
MKKENENTKHWLIRNLRNNFFSGLLIVIPLGVALAILAWVFVKVDDILQPIINNIGTFFNPEFKAIRGLGFIAAILLIYIVGAVTNNYMGKKIYKFSENLLNRVPIFKQLYNGVKQVVESLSGAGMNKAAFREVVFVEFPRKGMTTPAFVTNEFKGTSGEKLYGLYIPTAPIPTSGYFEIVEEDCITHTDLTIDDCIRMVVSGGMILPDSIVCGKTLVKAPRPIANAFTLSPKPEDTTHDE